MVEIIPKTKKPSRRISQWVVYGFGTVLVLLVFLYFWLMYLENIKLAEFWQLVGEESSIGSSEERLKEIEVLEAQRKINDFSKIFNNHRVVSPFFKLLENLTHPKVWFFSLNLDVKNSFALLSGYAGDFEALDQQLKIFEKEKMIEKVKLESLSIKEEGFPNFTLQLFLKKDLFKYVK